MNRRLQLTDFDPHLAGGYVDRRPDTVTNHVPDRVLIR
jgi:hypothetical protein